MFINDNVELLKMGHLSFLVVVTHQSLKIHTKSLRKIGYLMQNESLDDYCLPQKVVWAGSIAKFYDAGEYSVTRELWTSTSDWFRGDTSPTKYEENKKYGESQYRINELGSHKT